VIREEQAHVPGVEVGGEDVLREERKESFFFSFFFFRGVGVWRVGGGKASHLLSPSLSTRFLLFTFETFTKKQVWDSGKGYGEYTVKGK